MAYYDPYDPNKKKPEDQPVVAPPPPTTMPVPPRPPTAASVVNPVPQVPQAPKPPTNDFAVQNEALSMLNQPQQMTQRIGQHTVRQPTAQQTQTYQTALNRLTTPTPLDESKYFTFADQSYITPESIQAIKNQYAMMGRAAPTEFITDAQMAALRQAGAKPAMSQDDALLAALREAGIEIMDPNALQAAPPDLPPLVAPTDPIPTAGAVPPVGALPSLPPATVDEELLSMLQPTAPPIPAPVAPLPVSLPAEVLPPALPPVPTKIDGIDKTPKPTVPTDEATIDELLTGLLPPVVPPTKGTTTIPMPEKEPKLPLPGGPRFQPPGGDNPPPRDGGGGPQPPAPTVPLPSVPLPPLPTPPGPTVPLPTDPLPSPVPLPPPPTGVTPPGTVPPIPMPELPPSTPTTPSTRPTGETLFGEFDDGMEMFNRGAEALEARLQRSRERAKRNILDQMASRGVLGSSIESGTVADLESELAAQEMEGSADLLRQRNEYVLNNRSQQLQALGMDRDESFRYAAMENDSRFRDMTLQLQRAGMDMDQAYRTAALALQREQLGQSGTQFSQQQEIERQRLRAQLLEMIHGLDLTQAEQEALWEQMGLSETGPQRPRGPYNL